MSAVIKLSSPATREFWEIPVLYEDDYLLALDKPSRLLTSPDRYDPARPNLMRLLHDAIKRSVAWAQERKLNYLANAHRLDFETTGIILLAKDKPTLVALANQFGCEKPVKTYVGLVHGRPEQDTFDVDRKLGWHPQKVGVMRVDEKKGKRAHTRFQVLEWFRGYALVQCQPVTGRTHQIRVHLQSVRLPLVADNLYGGQPLLLSSLKSTYRLKPGAIEKPLVQRLALHAAELTLIHPVSHSPFTIAAPWPNDFEVAVKYLRRYAASAAA